MITIKNNKEIELMREAGRICATVIAEMHKHIVPGVTTKQLDEIAERIIRDNGATPSFKGLYGFPGSACVSVNNELIHGIPSNRILKEGDIVTIDVGLSGKLLLHTITLTCPPVSK